MAIFTYLAVQQRTTLGTYHWTFFLEFAGENDFEPPWVVVDALIFVYEC